jgi:hypothetical protein
VAFIQDPSGGFNVNVSVSNDFGSALSGSVEIFVNAGFFEHFNLDAFDSLRNERLFFSSPDFFLQQGEGFSDIQTHLESLDEYVLIRGFVDSGDGFGDFPFAIGLSPVTVDRPGDINFNGRVDRLDAATFAQFFGQQAGSTWTTGDFNGDGATTLHDWALLQSNFGVTVASLGVPAAAVPEPGSLGLAGGALIALVLRFGSRRPRVPVSPDSERATGSGREFAIILTHGHPDALA